MRTGLSGAGCIDGLEWTEALNGMISNDEYVEAQNELASSWEEVGGSARSGGLLLGSCNVHGISTSESISKLHPTSSTIPMFTESFEKMAIFFPGPAGRQRQRVRGRALDQWGWVAQNGRRWSSPTR